MQRIDEGLPLPALARKGDAGLDLYARFPGRLTPGGRMVVPTGIAVAIPGGFVGLLTPRSGLAVRHGIGIVNTPGVIDSGYRGEIHVVLVNLGQDDWSYERGDRVAQLVIVPLAVHEIVEVDELPESERGERGFGSTGA